MKQVTNVCDRCGTEIYRKNRSWICTRWMNIHGLHEYEGTLDGITNIDLCPKCRKSFEKWMRNGN